MRFSTRLSLSTFLMMGCSLQLYAQNLETAAGYRDVGQIEIDGTDTIPADTIRRKLGNLPEVVEALLLSIDDATYEYRVQDAVSRGFLASGFLDSKIEITSSATATGRLHVQVSEGPRFHRGAIVVRGGGDHVNRWAETKLGQLKTKQKRPKKLWQVGKPADGTLFGSLRITTAMQNGLTDLGMNGARATVEYIRRDDVRLIEAHIQLPKEDSRFEVPDELNAIAQVATSPAELVGGAAANDDSKNVAVELERTYQRIFSKPATGIIVASTNAKLQNHCGFGAEHFWAQLSTKKDPDGLAILLHQGSLLVNFDRGQASLRIPVMDVSLTLTKSSSAESSKGRTMKLTLGVAASSGDETPASTGCGFQLSPNAWKESFPADSTRITEHESGLEFESATHAMTLDREGDLVKLAEINSDDGQLLVTRATNDQIEKMALSLFSDSDVDELSFNDPVTGEQTTLMELIQGTFKSKQNDKEFRIPLANGQQDRNAVLLLSVANDGRFVRKDSLIARLMTLAALELSRHRRGISTRIAELEPEALAGPLTTLVLAEVSERNGYSLRAAKYYTQATRLARDASAIERDINLLFDSSNLPGRICEHIDIKNLLQVGLRLAGPIAETDTASQIESFVQTIPDATTATVRRDNARELAKMVFEMKFQHQLEQHCNSRIRSLRERDRKLAKKRKEKREKTKRDSGKSRLR